MDREREQRDHAAILREQNKNLHAYMTEKEDLAHQVAYILTPRLSTHPLPEQANSPAAQWSIYHVIPGKY